MGTLTGPFLETSGKWWKPWKQINRARFNRPMMMLRRAVSRITMTPSPSLVRKNYIWLVISTYLCYLSSITQVLNLNWDMIRSEFLPVVRPVPEIERDRPGPNKGGSKQTWWVSDATSRNSPDRYKRPRPSGGREMDWTPQDYQSCFPYAQVKGFY